MSINSHNLVYLLANLFIILIALYFLNLQNKLIQEKGWRSYFGVAKNYSIALGILTGIFIRLTFSIAVLFKNAANKTLFNSISLMSLSFLFLSPLIIGFIVEYFSNQEINMFKKIFRPWLSVISAMCIAGLLGLEGMICIIMALPIWCFLSSVGVIFAIIFKIYNPKQKILCLSLPLLPVFLATIELSYSSPAKLNTVYTYIDVKTTPEKIWSEIRSVKLIEEEESSFTLASVMGFPRPLAATLIGEGIGAYRKATFAGGVVFNEEITQWQENKLIAFNIKAVTAQIPNTTLDPHITIGGRFFDVIDGKYELERLDHETTRIHLSSRYRVTTNFNFYSSFWADLILTSIQKNILSVIKHRLN